VKKVWLVVALVALGGLAANSFADVQNIRLSGDIRTRGYWLNNAGNDGGGDEVSGTAAFISQRTRVSVEADLEDHVLVVVTLTAEGLWGDGGNGTGQDAGAGVGSGTSGTSTQPINNTWDTGVDEAYVQFNEMFYTPATLKVGRQYLMYGNGLILSSVEQEYNYDAARLVLDYYPATVDFVFAELVNGQSFGATPSHNGSADLLFVNGRYEISDSPLKSVEAYFGWVAQGSSGPTNTPNNPPTLPFFNPTDSGASPWIIGGRLESSPLEGLSMSLEAVYEGGSGGSALGDNISAYLLQSKGRYAFKDVSMSPAINWGGTMASGGGKGQDALAGTLGSGQFIPWYDYQEGYNGYIFSPFLSNIRILNVGGSVKPYENTSFSVQFYYYGKIDDDSPAGSNPNIDFGGLSGWTTTASSGDLGCEIDGILGYDYSKDVRFQLVYGAFIPGNAYKNVPTYGAQTVQEVRGEINVKF
jgi:hypothetical protein